MASRYYVNDVAQNNGDHEVHVETCRWLPSEQNRTYLGLFESCHGAVIAARSYHRQVNGCYYCSNPCHTS